MTLARILERWEVPVEEQNGGTKWFLDWATRSPHEVSKHLTAGWHAYRLLQTTYGSDRFRSTHEFFGGMGGQSLMIREMFSPAQHSVSDFSPEAVSQLKSLFHEEPAVTVEQRDAYGSEDLEYADLVGLDFGDFTVWRHREGEKHRKLLDRVVSFGPRAIVMTDIAGPRLHLQRERYETILGPGSCESQETYLDALVDLLEKTHGYRLLGGFYHRWSAVMVLVPLVFRNDERGMWLPVPSSPVGLEMQ